MRKTDPKALKEYQDAKAALNKLPTRDTEDAAYLKANQRVIDAEKQIPWWRR
jgi:hypothetical protein